MNHRIASLAGISLLLSGRLLPAETAPPPEDPLIESWYKQHLAAAQQRLAPTASRRDAEIDTRFVHLELSPDMDDGSLEGRAELLLDSCMDGLNQLELDLAANMVVDLVDGDAAGWTHQGDILVISLAQPADSGQAISLGIDYHGSPQSSGFGSWSLTTHAGTPILSTLSEPYGARSWWPGKDDPSDKADSANVWITVPAAYTATSNGLLAGVDTLGADLRFRWEERYPIASYLVSLAITNYERIDEYYVGLEGDSMLVSHYVYPEEYAQAAEDFNVTVPMLEFFSELWGEYPFIQEKYGHSMFPWGGAMEHQCNTSYGAVLVRGDHAYDRIVAHELAHQWWGDLVTCATFADIWLNEGFATYSEALWTEHVQGAAGLQAFMNSRCWVSDPSGPVYDPPSTFNSNTVYRKGAWLLHMLRGQIGEAAFRDVMRGWYDSPFRYGSARVSDFLSHVDAYTDKDLEGYWQGYLYGVNRPDLSWTAVARTHQGQDFAQVVLEQTQPEALFAAHFPLHLEQQNRDEEVWLHQEERIQGWAIPLPAPLQGALFDPEDWMLETHAQAALDDQVAQWILSARFADGSVPAEDEVSLRLSRVADPSDTLSLSCLDQGVLSAELKAGLQDWQPGDSLRFELRSLAGGHPQESRILFLAPGDAAWQDLGLVHLWPEAPPQLSILYDGELLQLSWNPLPQAIAYRVYGASGMDFLDAALLAEPTEPEWAVAPQDGLGFFRVEAVFGN